MSCPVAMPGSIDPISSVVLSTKFVSLEQWRKNIINKYGEISYPKNR